MAKIVPVRRGRWTAAAAAQARVVARMRERGYSLEDLKEAGREGRLAFGFTDFKDGEDVRVIQARGGARFLQKTTATVGVRDRFRRQHFERHRAVQLFVQRQVDSAHAARAERFQDSVMSD